MIISNSFGLLNSNQSNRLSHPFVMTQAPQVQADHWTQETHPKGKRTQKKQTKLKTSTMSASGKSKSGLGTSILNLMSSGGKLKEPPKQQDTISNKPKGPDLADFEDH